MREAACSYLRDHEKEENFMKKMTRAIIALSWLLAALLTGAAAVHAEQDRVLTLPSDLEVIEEEAFCGLEEVEEIIVPGMVTTIESRAFAESSVKYIYLPASVTTIAGDVLEKSSNAVFLVNSSRAAELCAGQNLPYIRYDIDAGNPRILKYSVPGTEASLPSVLEGRRVAVINNSAFQNNTELRSVVIPDGVTLIRDSAFSGCVNLTDITFPKTLKKIEQKAFVDCGKNAAETFYFVLPDDLEDIVGNGGGAHTFESCNAVLACGRESRTAKLLTERNYTYTTPGQYDFRYRYEKSTENGETVYHLNLRQYVGTGTEADIPEGVEIIYNGAFLNNTALTKVVIPDGVTLIRDSAFSGCVNLTDITFPETLKKIEQKAFVNCGKNAAGTFYFVLPDYMEEITAHAGGAYTFEDCDAVLVCGRESQTAKLLSDRNYTYTSPGQYDFRFRYKKSTEDGRRFDDYRLFVVGYAGTGKEVYIPEGVYGIERFKWDPPYGQFDPSFYGNTTIEKVVIPDGVEFIGDSVFCGCSMLSDVTLPASLKVLKNHAFENSGASSGKRYYIVLPSGLEEMTGNNAAGWASFNGCGAVLVAPPGSVGAQELYDYWWVFYSNLEDAVNQRNLCYKSPAPYEGFEYLGNP